VEATVAVRWRGGELEGVDAAAAAERSRRRRLGLEVGDLGAVCVGFDRGYVLNRPGVVSPDSPAM
jgi:hypothetical protein